MKTYHSKTSCANSLQSRSECAVGLLGSREQRCIVATVKRLGLISRRGARLPGVRNIEEDFGRIYKRRLRKT